MHFVHFVNMIDILTFQHDKFVMWCMYTLTKLCKIYNQCHTCNAHALWDSLFVALIRFQCGRYTFAMMHVLPKLTRNYSAPFYCDKHMGESQTVILLLPSDNVLHEMFPNNAREGIFKNMSLENTIVKIFKRMRKRALIFSYQPTCASTFHSVS